MKITKVGIIGTGFSAHAHLEALKRVPNTEVVAIMSRDLEKAKKVAKQFNIKNAYCNPTDLINDSEVESVHNCTSNNLHYPINKEVLQAGKHLLSEKPLALNTQESEELKDLAEQNQVVSGVCFNYRHFPMVRQIKEEIASNGHGQPHIVYGGYIQDWCLYETDYNWRMEKKTNGPSRAIADIGSHWCDTVQYVLGKKIIEVFADLKTIHPTRYKPKKEISTFGQGKYTETSPVVMETEDYGSVLIHFEDGTHGVFTVSQVNAGRKNRFHFEIATKTSTFFWDQEEPNKIWIGKKDQANLELMRDPALLSKEASDLVHYPGGHQEGWPDGLKNLLLDFYGTIRENKDFSFATFADGHRMMQLIEAIIESHTKKQWVQISD